jgi:hypothetical protein
MLLPSVLLLLPLAAVATPAATADSTAERPPSGAPPHILWVVVDDLVSTTQHWHPRTRCCSEAAVAGWLAGWLAGMGRF